LRERISEIRGAPLEYWFPQIRGRPAFYSKKEDNKTFRRLGHFVWDDSER
jgi:hypothetical protein